MTVSQTEKVDYSRFISIAKNTDFLPDLREPVYMAAEGVLYQALVDEIEVWFKSRKRLSEINSLLIAGLLMEMRTSLAGDPNLDQKIARVRHIAATALSNSARVNVV